MSALFNFRAKPNQPGAVWRDVTSSLDLSQLSNVSHTTEQAGGVPLIAAASDLSLTVHNESGAWDSIFDASRIVGTLVDGAALRAPAAHFGTVLLCRRSFATSTWQVLFFGFINPNSVKFNRQARTVTFTAYAPGKLLELGNSERVNRLWNVPGVTGGLARPFVIPVDPGTGAGSIQHPVPPSGIYTDADGDPIAPANDWWQLRNGAADGIQILAGDQFNVIRAVPYGAWTEGMQTVKLVDTTFVIVATVAQGDQLYFQTAEAPNDPALVSFAYSMGMEALNPWYKSRDWKDLIVGTSNPNCLQSEVNEALATLGVSDVVNFVIADPPDLPLLPVTKQLFAQLVYQPDVAGASSLHSAAK